MTTPTIKKEVTINEEQRLFVIPCGGGYSCLGFDVCKERSDKLIGWIIARELYAKLPNTESVGTIEAYENYRVLMNIAQDICSRDNTRCYVELIPQLIGLEGKRVEVVDRFGEKSRFWVGRSTGWMPCHLEIKNRNSSGGASVCGAPFKSITVVSRKRW